MRRSSALGLIVVLGAGMGAGLPWPTTTRAQAPLPFAPPGPETRVIYRHATLIDGALDPALAARATVVDLGGRYLFPGLIDAHVHLATPPNRRQAEAVLRRDLYGGVTAVRDMADDLRAVGELTRASLVGEIAGPDIYFAAVMAGRTFFTDRRTVQVSAGGVPGQLPWMQAVTDSTELPLAVARARGTSATAVKLYADLSPALAARITTVAHRQHLLVWSHATLFPAKPSDVVAAGVDALSHACLLVRKTQAQVPQWAAPRAPVPLDAFRGGRHPGLAHLFTAMARAGTIVDATVWTFAIATAPPTVRTPLPPGSCDDAVGGAITGQAFRAGVPIAAGTDSVAPWTDPWPDLFHELDALATKAGMPASAVLSAATLVGARAVGQAQAMGGIEAGKLANFVVLARNPLDDLANLKSVVWTVKRGRRFERRAFVPLTPGDITDF